MGLPSVVYMRATRLNIFIDELLCNALSHWSLTAGLGMGLGPDLGKGYVSLCAAQPLQGVGGVARVRGVSQMGGGVAKRDGRKKKRGKKKKLEKKKGAKINNFFPWGGRKSEILHRLSKSFAQV